MVIDAASRLEFKPSLRAEIAPGAFGKAPGLSLHFGHTYGVLIGDKPYERKLLSLLDGSRTCGKIVEELQRHDPQITPEKVYEDLENLFNFGLLQNAAADTAGLTERVITMVQRHISFLGLLDETGERRHHLQKRLSDSHVTVLGTGAMGSAVLDLLGRIGVGNFLVVDHDTVEESNLIRGRFTRADIGKAKTQVAREILLGIDDTIHIETLEKRICSAEDIVDILRTGRETDLVLLCADEPDIISYWMNKAAIQTGIPFIASGYQGIGAEVGPLVIPGETDCLMCLLGGETSNSEDDPRPAVPQELVWLNERAARQHPSDATHTAFVASRLVYDVEMYLIGQKPQTLGRVLTYDPSAWAFRPLKRRKVRNCPACGRQHLMRTTAWLLWTSVRKRL